MEWNNKNKILALLLVVCGSINSITSKWADDIKGKNSVGEVREFTHPFIQTGAMFLGEMICLLAYKVMKWKDSSSNTSVARPHVFSPPPQYSPFILMPAAILDLVGTSIMYVGLSLTYVSSFQMFRGSIIIFVALLSVTFVNRHILTREWTGIAFVICGLVVVGVTDAIYTEDSSRGPNSVITGDLLIVLAQVVSACQMVYEEKYLTELNIPPLRAVGLEGVFGFSILSLLLVAFYWIPAPPYFNHNNPRGVVEDVIDGFIQIGNNPLLIAPLVGTILSIPVFNYAGVSVTKNMSATTRMILDSIRTLVVWLFSLAVFWQAFHLEHLAGFSILIAGTFVYNIQIQCLQNTSGRFNLSDAEEVRPEEEVTSTPADCITSALMHLEQDAAVTNIDQNLNHH